MEIKRMDVDVTVRVNGVEYVVTKDGRQFEVLERCVNKPSYIVKVGD